MQKKTSLTELFYLTLLITALRPPDNALHYHRERAWYHGSADTLGPILAEDICFTGHRYLNSGPFYNEYVNSKSPILLDETHQVLQYINSLGRYSEPAPYNSNLFAYPVSRGLTNDAEDSVAPFEDTSISVPSTTSFNQSSHVVPVNDPASDLLTEFENFNFDSLEDLSLDLFNLNEDVLLNDNSPLFDDNNGNHDGQIGSDPFEQSIDVDELLADSSVMFPILDSNEGDVNDLFGELELLLSNETDNYGQEWQASTFYTPLTNGETADYSLYDSANIATDTRPIESCTIFEPTSGAGQMTTNPSGSFSNGSNFGAVLYSSLTTLSNGNEHINGELAPSHLVYNSTDINDLAYMSNVSNISVNNVSSSDCFYNGYLPDELPISEVNAANASQYSYQNQQSTCYTPTTTNPANQNQFSTPATEDCFDKSSDSAVSSMSSDRVHSFSDNDWVETSSESSYNGEVNLSDYSNNENKCGSSAAQKKYRLFGKNKNSSQEYYIDYGQTGYVYSNSCQVNSNENFNQLNYYSSSVNHNHTYAQPIEVAPLASMSSNIPSNSWSSNESVDDANSVKKEETPRSTKSSNKKPQSNLDALKKDPHLNRDEKRARALKIPITTQEIINLPIDEFNERLTKFELTEIQLSLIRDIRRRGKNKVAAQNCRKRKLDQIMGLQTEVDSMFNQKGSLEAQYDQLLMIRDLARDKYTKLYQFVVESSASRQPFFDLTASPPGFPDKDISQEVQLNDNVSNTFVVSANISATVPVSSFGVQSEFSKQE